MKNVIISIQGRQQADGDAAPDNLEFITNGTYCHQNGEVTLSYMESEMTGMPGTRTTFRVRPDAVTLTREGQMNSQMIFQTGKKNVFLYETPYGAMSMGVHTRRMRQGLDEMGGKLELNYAIDVDNLIVSENSFVIKVRESGKEQEQTQWQI